MDLNAWVRERTPRFGTLLSIDNAAAVEIAQLSGFDWLWIDGEHGQFNEVSAAAASALCSAGPLTFVRLPDFSPTAIKRYLETGCDAIILPAVSTIEDVRAIARAALYPPRGQRSVGIARAQGYGSTFQEYLTTKSYSVVAQIETVAGVQNAREIVGQDAIDAVIIGPYDLSGSFGIPGQVEAPEVVAAIAEVHDLCKEADKPCGIFAATAEKARAYAAQGFDLIAVGIDSSILMNAYRQLLQSMV
ncbi:HpcH/HpaI aldolase family protein [Occallatibacter riparius]|uniref:Aldolase/citrate lyase family protein n=1 Tax=Occallatibacter riparius TaxID=1002689 RepID=A0A9J7BXF9_9BACT|nr:aldolase/citrate lyase family protein [Occallatibacter riparius]UWZ86586.1 aldolase/citrate lyase family protein [Occallatibacter riparius]